MSDTTENQPKKPNDRITVEVNSEKQEVFMSGGLLRKLAPMCGQLTEFSDIFTNPDLQNALVVEALSPRTPHGQLKKVYTIDDFELSIDESDKLINWITGHVLHFFLNSVSNAQKLTKEQEPALKALETLMLSLTGSPDSTEQKPSVGPSEQSQVK